MKQLVLALGSGGVRGFAHIGVLKALDEHQLKVHCVYGTSAGSLVGAFYQSGLSAAEIEKIAVSTFMPSLVDLRWPSNGFILGQSLQGFIQKNISAKDVQNLPRLLRVIATKANDGSLHIIQQGSLAAAVQASCSIPGVFRPASFENQKYLDGDLKSPVPMYYARQEFPNAIVMGVNIIPAVSSDSPKVLGWSKRVSKNSYRSSLIEWERPFADLYLDIQMDPIHWNIKKWGQKQIELAYNQTLKTIPKLKQFLDIV